MASRWSPSQYFTYNTILSWWGIHGGVGKARRSLWLLHPSPKVWNVKGERESARGFGEGRWWNHTCAKVLFRSVLRIRFDVLGQTSRRPRSSKVGSWRSFHLPSQKTTREAEIGRDRVKAEVVINKPKFEVQNFRIITTAWLDKDIFRLG